MDISEEDQIADWQRKSSIECTDCDYVMYVNFQVIYLITIEVACSEFRQAHSLLVDIGHVVARAREHLLVEGPAARVVGVDGSRVGGVLPRRRRCAGVGVGPFQFLKNRNSDGVIIK